jgi:hypothetical protein
MHFVDGCIEKNITMKLFLNKILFHQNFDSSIGAMLKQEAHHHHPERSLGLHPGVKR